MHGPMTPAISVVASNNDRKSESQIEELQELLQQKPKVKLEQLQEIIRRFDDHQRLMARPRGNDFEVEIDSEPDRMLALRLDRAVMNQVVNGQATVSRYAIWADTVRDLIRRSLKELELESGFECSKSSLTQSANSLSAFSEIQAQFDPFTSE